jgi:hypothetical protein
MLLVLGVKPVFASGFSIRREWQDDSWLLACMGQTGGPNRSQMENQIRKEVAGSFREK